MARPQSDLITEENKLPFDKMKKNIFTEILNLIFHIIDILSSPAIIQREILDNTFFLLSNINNVSSDARVKMDVIFIMEY